MKITPIGQLVKTNPIKPNSNQIQTQLPKRPKMNINFCKIIAYENKPLQGQNKPNQTQFPGSASSCDELVERSAIWPDEAVFSFDLVARPVILNPNIRQLRRPMKSKQIGPFKARKETYHVY